MVAGSCQRNKTVKGCVKTAFSLRLINAIKMVSNIKFKYITDRIE
jgi:hypothetical protein